MGEFPCGVDGQPIKGIENGNETKTLTEGVVVNYTFSAKPHEGVFADYYAKITSYFEIIAGPALELDSSTKAKTFLSPTPKDGDTVFSYTDSNSSRAGILNLAAKMKRQKIAIIGVGGTGSYVLDFVAKTEVEEIHLFDGDDFSQHNAFRAPGAPSLEALQKAGKKPDYLQSIYSANRRGIISHPEFITAENIDQLREMSFVFVCIDKPNIKSILIPKLLEFGISFIDVGMGINLKSEALIGNVSLTLVTPEKNDHVGVTISTAGAAQDDYAENIQIAELNALNAALAVIKWKKLNGFYHDEIHEHSTSFIIETGLFNHEDKT